MTTKYIFIVTFSEFKNMFAFPYITSYNSFVYSESQVTCFQQYKAIESNRIYNKDNELNAANRVN